MVVKLYFGRAGVASRCGLGGVLGGGCRASGGGLNLGAAVRLSLDVGQRSRDAGADQRLEGMPGLFRQPDESVQVAGRESDGDRFRVLLGVRHGVKS